MSNPDEGGHGIAVLRGGPLNGNEQTILGRPEPFLEGRCGLGTEAKWYASYELTGDDERGRKVYELRDLIDLGKRRG